MSSEKDGTTSQTDQVEEEFLPKKIFILPITERPFFPPQTLPIIMREENWEKTVKYISQLEKNIAGLVLVNSPTPEEATYQDFCKIGTLIKMHEPISSSGKIQFIGEGLQRFRIKKWLSKTPPFEVEVEYSNEPKPLPNNDLKAHAIALISILNQLHQLEPFYKKEIEYLLSIIDPNKPSQLADFAASITISSNQQLQDVLETLDLKQRMKKVLSLLKKELTLAKLQNKLQQQVKDSLTEHQRKFFLHQQLKTIQKELGLKKDDTTTDLERFKANIEGKSLTSVAKQRFQDEMDKLSVLESGSPEYAVTRNYLDIFSKIPWGVLSQDNIQLKHARKMLNKQHSELTGVKNRIIEFLAVAQLKGEVSGSILLLIGPPGVGKTSIGRSIATALNRKFYRFSVAGLKDEAEIKGHRRTYIGAMPGKLAQALTEIQTLNPVIMLDEIDKIGASNYADPSSALLEALDPEQNNQFLDHYLDLRLDLSKVLFICTANQTESIPNALLDRMEIIRLSGYIHQEKMTIAKQHLWPRQLQKAGLTASNIKLTDTALSLLISQYSRDAGVRGLDKLLAKMIRKCAVDFITHHSKKISINKNNLSHYLGSPMFTKQKLLSGIGVCSGLAWTSMGGIALSIEAALIHSSSRGFKLTGQLGHVMKESADIAYSYIAANLKKYGADVNCLEKKYIHLHVPEGATPKDGPSAGITMATALLSLLLKQKIKNNFVMTGELTLTGHVLAVGGIREKIIAAKREGIKHIILPKSVSTAYQEIPKQIKQDLNIYFVEHYDHIFKLLF